MNKKNRIIEEYEVNPHTVAIIPAAYGSKTYSEVLELEDQFVSPFKPIEIIKKSCEFFGSSYEGRRDGTKRLTGITHKAPIILDPHTLIYFFPTASPSNPQCMWISHEHIETREPCEGNNTLVLFRNKKSLTVPMSVKSFDNQMLRTSRLRISFMQQIQYISRKYPMQSGFFMHLEASERKRSYQINQELD